jgi:tetratricopeptide (TPR) repeat protein
MNWKPLVASVTFALMAPVMVGGVIDTGVAMAASKTISAKLGKPLQEAQAALNAKDYNKALQALQAAKQIDKRSAYENYVIAQFETNAYVGLKQYANAAKSIQATIDSGQAAPEEVTALRKNLVQIHYSTKNYSGAVQAADAYLRSSPNDLDMIVLKAQSQYLMGQCGPAVGTIKQASEAARATGRPMKEDWLQLQLSCAHKANDKSGVANALEQLVRAFPSKDYWRDLIIVYRGEYGTTDALNLESFRLMHQTDTMKTADDYVEHAQIALLLGLPGEAKAVIEEGFQKKLLGGADQGRHERLRKMATDQATQDQAGLAALEKEAAASPTGEKHIALAEAYASYGMYDKAVAAYQAGLKKGGLRNTAAAQLQLGQSLLKAGKKAEAVAAFKAVKGDPAYEKLASYWQLAAA